MSEFHKISLARLLQKLKIQHGFTMVEMLMAILIFSVVSTGVAGVFIVSLRSNQNTRLATKGEHLVQQQLEEMRARPYYINYSTDAAVGTQTDTDMMDFYYPDVQTTVTTDSRSWEGWYTRDGADAYYTKVSPPDENGYTLTVVTRFVDNQQNVVVPYSSYANHNTSTDRPASNLVKVTVTADWPVRNTTESFTLESLISSTGQSEATADCEHASNSSIDVTGASLLATLGVNILDIDLNTTLLKGTFSDVHAATSYGCPTSMEASANSGKLELLGLGIYQGASVDVTGPPDAQKSAGPLTVTTPLLGWPSLTLGSSAHAEIESDPEHAGYEAEAEGEAKASNLSIGLGQIDGIPLLGGLGSLLGYKAWDMANPVIALGGGAMPEAKAEIKQENGATVATGSVTYPQFNILPMGALTANTPSASQGIIFIRNFHAESRSEANALPGGASSSLTYSASIGMFNPNKSASCTGDGCYDIYETIGPTNPVQVALGLTTNPAYALQANLVTELSSATTADIASALSASADGTKASVSMDSLLKLQIKYGTSVKLGGLLGDVNLLSLQGLVQLKIGTFNASVQQNQ